MPIRVEVRDKQFKPVTQCQSAGAVPGAGRVTATMELTPVPLEEGIYGGEWTAEKPGSYVAEIIAGHEQEEIGHDVLTLPARGRRGGELPHVAESRTAGETGASRPAGGTTSRLTRPS